MGNGGCGKTWLARKLGDVFGHRVIHLDDLHWEPGNYGIVRDRTLRDKDVQIAREADYWIMEGVYGQLIQMALGRATTLIWLDLPEEECIANIRRRGIQGGGSQTRFQDLLQWVAEYGTRTNWNSFKGHKWLFDGFSGPKALLRNRAKIADYLDRISQFEQRRLS
ncbi:AAA family ATPase [Microvirga sp. TS319]|uniref:AAA family ATPase n=1 Tax=Microvirga sp. TS319 TaxID=3241165 RepID=UPI00351A4169